MTELTAIDVLIDPDDAALARARQVNARVLKSMPGWAWGSETPIRNRITPVRSANVVSPLPCHPGSRPSPRQRSTA